jgi:uracil-DNA glycosylase family 4
VTDTFLDPINVPRVIADFDPLPGQTSALIPLQDATAPAGMLDCRACSARSEARRVVPGVGPADATVLVLGQNPGEDEDAQGVPLVGLAGLEFDKWLAVLGMARERLFLSYIVKCHTADNRLPRTVEVQTCSNQWLPVELGGLPNVQVIFPMGKTAIARLLGKSAPPVTPLMVHHLRIRVLGREVSVFPLPAPRFLLRAQHMGPVFRETLLPQIRRTLQQELPLAYDACRRH